MERAFHELGDQSWLIVQHGRNTPIATDLPLIGSKDRLLEQAQRVLAEMARLARAIEAVPGS
jgi:hypothetical protein